MNPHTPKWTPTLGVGVPMDSRIFIKQFQGSRLIRLKSYLYHWKAIETQMPKMGSHYPFKYLKHKLWPKKRARVKVSIWLSTIKSQKSPQFPYVQVACHIWLKISRLELQLCFRPHLNQRSTKKCMDFQSCGQSQFWEFWDSNLGVLGQNDIWVLVSRPSTKNNIRGKVMASPKSRSWWVLWICLCPWFVCAPKMFQLCTNQLVIWFVQVHVNNWFTCHSS
jgi:hypothetical protein